MTFATLIPQMRRISVIALAGLLLTPGTSRALSVPDDALTTPVVIYQVQSGAPASASQEYIALYNNTDAPVDITNWCVVYASSSDASQIQLGCMKPASTPAAHVFLKPHTAWLLASTEFIQAHSAFTPDMTFKAGLAATSGHLKLFNTGQQLVDSVGWGAAIHPEGSATAAAAAGKILQRHGLIPEPLQDLNNNAADFYQTELILPVGGNISEEVLLPERCDATDSSCVDNSTAGPGLVLSELLADAIGTDAGQEFIEVYNPADTALSTSGYSLQLGSNLTKSYRLPEVLIEAKSYRAFSDSETGLTLPNTSASLRLVAPDGTTSSEVAYTELEEGASLVYINASWQQTYLPTPGAENSLVAIKPCLANQVRNPESGQCKQNTIAAAITPCKAGQIRSLETGRCRNIATPAVATACKAGQQKNPATNRCINIPAAAVTKACPAGQERNPETGRCKKISAIAASGTNSVKDVPGSLISSSRTWLLVGAVATGTISYALFEWRQEIFGFTNSLKNKLVPG